MDLWQLLHLSLSFVLPLRPEEAAGLLVSEVSFENSWLVFGTRFGGFDFTKGHTSFKLPFPAELVPVLQACIGGRSEGPLLRMPMLFDGRRQYPTVDSAEGIQELVDRRLRELPPDAVASMNDRKDVFRSVLSDLGGVSTDKLAASFKTLAHQGGLSGVTLKTLRSSATTSMQAARLSHLAMRYLTSHTTKDILNTYTALDMVSEMRLYFQEIQPLLDAIVRQEQRLGISPAG
jgi:integrase